VCPCPLTTPSNQFGRECYLDVDRQVTCRCAAGYTGRRCGECSPGYVGNPARPGGNCQPGKFLSNCRLQFCPLVRTWEENPCLGALVNIFPRQMSPPNSSCKVSKNLHNMDYSNGKEQCHQDKNRLNGHHTNRQALQ
jgi:hypothetical protein